MDVVPDNENGRETRKNLKENIKGNDIEIDLNLITSIQFDISDSLISRQNSSLSSSSANSSPKSVVTERAVLMEESPNQSPKELLLPGLLDHPNSSPPDFSPQFTPVLQSPQIRASSARPSSSGYDPNRIPASIFSRPSTPMEWSVASNDSLFSIHVGNTSFSKDQFYMMYRSGDLSKLDDLNFASSSTIPRLSRANSGDIKRVNFEINNNNEESVKHETKTRNSNAKDDNDDVYCADISFRPNESYRSTLSFQFPVLPDHEGGKIPFPVVDSRRHRGEAIFQPQQLEQVMHQNEQSQRVETKPNYGISNWWVCFFCCCRPCS